MNYESGSFRGQRRRLATESFKMCPLCGALNAETNHECFVCAWHGVFDHNEDSVVEALDLLIERCPELAVEFTAPPPRLTPLQRIRGWVVGKMVRWVLGDRAK